MRTFGVLILAAAMLDAASIPAAKPARQTCKRNPFRIVKKLAAGEVTLAERFSGWGIREGAATIEAPGKDRDRIAEAPAPPKQAPRR